MKPKIGKKLRAASHNANLLIPIKKESVCAYYFIVHNTDNTLYILSLCRQRTNQLFQNW